MAVGKRALPGPDRAAVFVRVLLPQGVTSRLPDGRFEARRAGRTARLEAPLVEELASVGVLVGQAPAYRAAPEARSWLRRRTAGAQGFAHQHGATLADPGEASLDLAESPLARLAAGGAAAFLLPHQVAAGERIRQLAERAHLRQRLTMSYSPRVAAGTGSAAGAAHIPDFAIDARRRLNACLGALPPDCAGVVFDVCGLLKGLQQVETERGWPRRSAKLVLRIGLDQAAAHFGLDAVATGTGARQRGWLGQGARPDVFE